MGVSASVETPSGVGPNGGEPLDIESSLELSQSGVQLLASKDARSKRRIFQGLLSLRKPAVDKKPAVHSPRSPVLRG